MDSSGENGFHKPSFLKIFKSLGIMCVKCACLVAFDFARLPEHAT